MAHHQALRDCDPLWISAGARAGAFADFKKEMAVHSIAALHRKHTRDAAPPAAADHLLRHRASFHEEAGWGPRSRTRAFHQCGGIHRGNDSCGHPVR